MAKANPARTKRSTQSERPTRTAEKAKVVPLRRPPEAPAPIGCHLGTLVDVDEHQVLVQIAHLGPRARRAQSLVPFADLEPGDSVVLTFVAGDMRDPVILGRLYDPDAPPRDLRINGRKVTIEAGSELNLTCSAATIRATRDGMISVRGDRITTEARRSNRVRGGSVEIN